MALHDTKYDEVKNSIDDNVRTIGYLIQQTNDLKAVIQTLEDSETKQKLNEATTHLTDTINKLIVDTTELFNNLADVGPNSTTVQ
jgi:hypothetical protein